MRVVVPKPFALKVANGLIITQVLGVVCCFALVGAMASNLGADLPGTWTVSCLTMAGQSHVFHVDPEETVPRFRASVAARLAVATHQVQLLKGDDVVMGGALLHEILVDEAVLSLVLLTSPEISSISAGVYHTAAITSMGRALCWGCDDCGQVSEIPELNADEIFMLK